MRDDDDSRKLFAGLALVGLVSGGTEPMQQAKPGEAPTVAEDIAKRAFDIADAMLAESIRRQAD